MLNINRRSLLSSVGATALAMSLGPAFGAAIGGASGISSAGGGSGGGNTNPVIATTGGLVMNLAGVSYFSGDCPFLNLLKGGGQYGINCQQTCTFTNGSANINYPNHNASVGTFVSLSNSGGALPTNFSSATQYYVHQIIDPNTITVTVTPGGGGTAVVAGSAGSGTQTMSLSFGGADAWATGYLDGNGNLISPLPAQVKSVAWNFFTPPPNSNGTPVTSVVGWQSYLNRVFNVTWTGAATAVAASFSFYGSGGGVSSGANSATITLGNSGTIQNIGVQLNITDPNNPPQKPYVYLPKYAANVAAGQFWNPDFLASIKPFAVLRFMDWMNTNGNVGTTTGLSNLCDANYFYGTGVFDGSTGPKGGIHPSLVCNLARLTGCNVHYNLPVGITNANATAIFQYFAANMPSNLYAILEYGNENWNFTLGVCFNYCNSQIYPGNGSAGAPAQFSGYRAAQLWELAYAAYGTGGRARWRGALGTKFVDSSNTSSVVVGSQYWVANGATHTFAQLCDTVLVAPYFGDFINSVAISSITAGNPTTINTTSGLPSNYITGYVARLFVPSGTGGAALNNQSFAITVTGANQFTVAVNTTGDTFSGTLYAADGNLFTIFDTSLSNFSSDPVTWPTKYTYAANQLATSFATGTCSGGFTTGTDASYTGNGNITGGMGLRMAQQALAANENGLTLTGYEGGANFGTVDFNNNLQNNAQFMDYAFNCINEPGTIAHPGYSLAYAAEFNAWNLVNSAYPAQYTSGGYPGIWGSRRGFTDTTSGTWVALLAETALGPYVDPTPAATGTYVYCPPTVAGANQNFSTTLTFQVNFGGAGSGKIIVGVQCQSSAPSSVTVNSTSLSVDVGSGQPASIWSGDVTWGSDPQTITIVRPSGGTVFTAFVVKATNLINDTVQTTQLTFGNQTTVGVTKGALMVVVGNSLNPSSWTGSITPTGAVSGAFYQGTFAYWTGSPGNYAINFTSSLFAVAIGTSSSGIAIATYR